MKQALIFGSCIHAENGTKHANSGKPCEDAVSRCCNEDTGVVAVALSDGAGSYEHAREGALMLSEAGAKLLASKFEKLWELDRETMSNYIISAVCHPLNNAMEKNGWTMQSMYATLLIAAKHPDGRYITFHSGDGVIIGYTPGKGCKVISRYEHTVATNLVTFVNSPKTEYVIRTGVNGYVSFLLSSDGAEPYLVPEGTITAPILMLMQAAFLLSESETENYIHALMESTLRNVCHADDDLSFALLFDIGATSAVLDDMAEPFLCAILDIPKMPDKSRLRKYATIISELRSHPNGVSCKDLTRLLHLHKTDYMLKHVRRMFSAEYIGADRGRIYLK